MVDERANHERLFTKQGNVGKICIGIAGRRVRFEDPRTLHGQSPAFSGARWVRVPAVPNYRGVARDMIVCSLPETYSQKGTWGEYWIILESNTEMPTRIVTP